MSVSQRVTKAENNLRNRMMLEPNTSRRIRFLHAKGKSILEIEQILRDCEVTTKDKHPIRYQHIRNVLMTKLASDEEVTQH